MTIYYVDPSAALGTQDGLTKENAFLSLAAALAAATASGDEIRCAHDKTEVLGADTTFTIASSKLTIVSWNFIADVEAGGFKVGHSSLNRSISFVYGTTPAAGDRVLRIAGITFQISGSTTDSLNLFTAHAGLTVFWEDCYFLLYNTSLSSRINIGGGGEFHGVQYFSGCYFELKKSAHSIVLGDHLIRFSNCDFVQITELVTTALFTHIEQGPDVVLEGCTVYGSFADLIGGVVTGTRVIRMIGGVIHTANWMQDSFPPSETGLWGHERVFEDVTVVSWNTGETAKYSGIRGRGRKYTWYQPDADTLYQSVEPGIYIRQDLAPSDLASAFRPIIPVKIKKTTNQFPEFFRFYFATNSTYGSPITALVSFVYSGEEAGVASRKQAYNVLNASAAPSLVLDTTPPEEISAWALSIGSPTNIYYLDIPLDICTHGNNSFFYDLLKGWEAQIKLLLRDEFEGAMYHKIFLDGVADTSAYVDMIGGQLVQTFPGIASLPDPIPGYKSLVLHNGSLAQVDVTLNAPPTGTPAVWDGTVLRTLLPGESVVLQNP